MATLRERFGLSEEAVQQAYQLQRTTRLQMQQQFAGANPGDPQRVEVLLVEQQRMLRQILGDRAFQALNRGGGRIRYAAPFE